MTVPDSVVLFSAGVSLLFAASRLNTYLNRKRANPFLDRERKVFNLQQHRAAYDEVYFRHPPQERSNIVTVHNVS